MLKHWIPRTCYQVCEVFLTGCVFNCFRGWDAAEGQVHWWAGLQKSSSELLSSWHPVWNGKLRTWTSLSFNMLKCIKLKDIYESSQGVILLVKWYWICKMCYCKLCNITEWLTLLCFGDSVWTWENAPRSMTWRCGQIMKLPPRREICSLSLM